MEVLELGEVPSLTIKHGKKTKKYDPISLLLKLQAFGAINSDGNATDDLAKLVDGVREVFDLPDLGDSEAVTLILKFLAYSKELQKKMLSMLNSSASTAQDAENSLRVNVSGSGSTFPLSQPNASSK